MSRGRKRFRPDSRPRAALARSEQHWVLAVVRASYRLPDSAKLLYAVLLELDRPERDGVGGASMSYVELARQIGKSADYTGDLRQHLEALGLLLKVVVRGMREAFWFLTLPAAIEREPPSGSSAEEKRRWVQEQRDALDRHLAALEAAGVATPLTEAKRRVAARRDTGVRTSASQQYTGVPTPVTQANVRPPALPTQANVHSSTGERTPASEHEKTAERRNSETLKTSETMVSHSPTPPKSDSDRTRSKTSETRGPVNVAKLRTLVDQQHATTTPATPHDHDLPPGDSDEELPATLSQDLDDSPF